MKIGIVYRKSKEYSEKDKTDLLISELSSIITSFGFEVTAIPIHQDPIKDLEKINVDFVLNLYKDDALHKGTLEPHISALLDVIDIPHSGSDFNCITTCIDKARTKEILSYYKIRTPKFQVFKTGLEKLNRKLTFPLFVKPCFGDDGEGITEESIVHTEEELFKEVDTIHKNFKQSALVEEYIDGREIIVCVIGNKQKIVLPLYEISFENYPEGKEKIHSHKAHSVTTSIEYKNKLIKCPTELPKAVEATIKRISLKLFDLLSLNDYARIDFRIDKTGTPYVLDVSSHPNISEDGILAKMCDVMGLSYDQAVYLILKNAMERAGIARKRLPAKPNTQIQRSIKEYEQKDQ